ncbi:unnamed protein product, partial [Meganyctiphanes norvegica]
MKTNAAEYFNSLSPLKADGKMAGGSKAYESYLQNGRSGRCHCCPYGYHIDLDFVRYCDRLNQGSKNETPTLRQMKKLKRDRRRQTKSMEVLLGISPSKENEEQQSITRLEIIEEPLQKTEELVRKESLSKAKRSLTLPKKIPPPPPPRRSTTPIMSPPPDIINSSSNGRRFNATSNIAASEALQEAVMDFEEMFENSCDSGRMSRSETLPPNLPSLDLLHHTQSGYYEQTNGSIERTGTSVSRSHSLPRQFPDDSPQLGRHRTNSTSSLSSISSASGLQSAYQGYTSYAIPHYSTPNNITPHSGWRNNNYPGSGSQLSEHLAALNAARGYPQSQQPDMETMSITSAMSTASTTTLQSIRDQMAHSLNRLKNLEEEVKTIPMLQIKLNVLKEEKRLLLHQLKTVCKKGDLDLLLPPNLDGGDLTDYSEDELDGRLTSLRTGRKARRRSESPMRVNLEDFRSYRRARVGSISDGGSDVESAPTPRGLRHEDNALFIREAADVHTERRQSHSTPNTPHIARRSQRDVSTSCRVLTRDVGISHVGARTRSVGLTTDLTDNEKKKEVKAKPCMQCFQRNKKSFESIGVGTPDTPRTDKMRKLSISNVSLESVEPDEVDTEIKDGSENNSKNAFLQKLGRKSAIISRLSEPQLVPPVLTFDNSTNTETVRKRDQRNNTSMSMDDIYSRSDLNESLSEAKKEWEAITKEKVQKETEKVKESSQHEINRSLLKAKKEWNIASQEKLEKEIENMQAKTQAEVDKCLSEAKKEWEVSTEERIQKEIEAVRERSESVAKKEWDIASQEKLEKEIEKMQAKTQAEIDKCLSEAKKEWEVSTEERMQKEIEAVRERSASVVSLPSRPLTLDCGIQVSVTDPNESKTKFRPLMQSVGVMVKVSSKDMGVGSMRINDLLCDNCSNTKTRSIGSGDSALNDLLCDKCSNVKTRSISIGTVNELKLEKPPPIQTRSIGCSFDKISDRYCDHCDNVKKRSVAVGDCTVQDEKPNKKTCTFNSSVQTKCPDVCNIGINTMPLPIKRDELNFEAVTTLSSPAGTPEVERRSFGSAGVRVCDKCHEAITSLAKDVVNTSGTAQATNLPPIPPVIVSKIPRLVDIQKSEIRQDPRFPGNMSVSGGSSISESQVSSLSSSFTESKIGAYINKSVSQSTGTTQTTTTSSVTKTSQSTSSVTNKSTSQAAETNLTSTGSSKTSSGIPSSNNSPQAKRAPYTRQQTYTKFSEGFVNLGFDEKADSERKLSDKNELPNISENNNNIIKSSSSNTSLEKSPNQKVKTLEKKIVEKTTLTDISPTKVTSEKLSTSLETNITKTNRPDSETVMNECKESTTTTATVSEVWSGSESGDEESIISTQTEDTLPPAFQNAVAATATDQPIHTNKPHKKVQPPREMKAALKVLNDAIGKPARSGQQLTNALNIVQREWLKVSSQKDANPHVVEDYMDVFEDFSKQLLQRVVNLSDVNGNTAMHYAVSHGNFDVVSILLDSKVCYVNHQNKAGYTAVMLVSLAQIRSDAHAAVVQRLFQMGDVNIKASQHGQTALMLAVAHGRLDMVRLLVSAGADINISDEDGSTALMCSSEHGHLAIVKYLLGQPDCDPTLMDNITYDQCTIVVCTTFKDIGFLIITETNIYLKSIIDFDFRIKRSRTPTMSRSAVGTPPPRSSAPSSPGRSRKSSGPPSPGRSRQSSASLSNLIL